MKSRMTKNDLNAKNSPLKRLYCCIPILLVDYAIFICTVISREESRESNRNHKANVKGARARVPRKVEKQANALLKSATLRPNRIFLN